MAFLDWLSTKTQVRSAIPSASVRSRLQDPYYRFQSVEEVAIAASLGVQLDVNQASVDDWLRLPGVSIHQARLLVDLTRSGVQFHCLDDIAAALSLSVQRLKPLEPVLRFCYYDPESVCMIQPLNPNSATVEMLMRIPGMELYLARAIVQNRAVGPYRNLTHLQRRLSLPAATVAELMHYLTF